MKALQKIALIIVLLAGVLVSKTTSGQKFAYIDSEYILDQMPEYKSAQKKLDELADQWQKDIEKRLADIDKMYKDYQAEQVLLTEEQKQKKQSDIIAKEKELKEFQKQKFGTEGELFKKRQELIKPIQDKIFDAVQKLAKQSALDFIFDKSGDTVMMFTNAKYDRSDDILELMGYTPTNSGK